MRNLTCLRCGHSYEQAKRRASHFCAPCRVEVDRAKAAERMRRLRELKDEVRSWPVEADAAGLDVAPLLWNVAELRLHLGLDDTDDLPVGLERPLPGATSPAGPYEGFTVARGSELAGQVYGHGRHGYGGAAGEAASDPFWTQHAHWSYKLHDPAEASQYLDLAAA